MAFAPEQHFMIGPLTSGSAGMVNLEVTGDTNDYTAPHYVFKPYTKQITLGDGTVRGAGWTYAEWTWDVISQIQREWLRTFCTGQSSEVMIQMPTMDAIDSDKIFSAVMIWPIDSEQHDAHRRMQFVIKFQRMIQQ